jgi:hypothetical protein
MISQGHSPTKSLLQRLRPGRFLEARQAENDYACLIDTLKYRFIHLTKVVNFGGQKAENSF